MMDLNSQASRVAVGMGMGMIFSPVGIPMGILWESP